MPQRSRYTCCNPKPKRTAEAPFLSAKALPTIGVIAGCPQVIWDALHTMNTVRMMDLNDFVCGWLIILNSTPKLRQIYSNLHTMLFRIIGLSLLLASSMKHISAQIAVSAGCGSVGFGDQCSFTATGNLGNTINWVVSGGAWNWTPPQNPGTPWNIDTDKTYMSATCRAYPHWYQQSLSVTINSNGQSAQIQVPVRCYGPDFMSTSMSWLPQQGWKSASAIVIAQLGKSYGSELPGSGDFVHYPNGWQYLDNGHWNSLVEHNNAATSPIGVKYLQFKQCLLVDSTLWESDESRLRWLYISPQFQGLQIRKWLEKCERDTIYSSVLQVPGFSALGVTPQSPEAVAVRAQANSDTYIDFWITNPAWEPVAIVSITGQQLPLQKLEGHYRLEAKVKPGYFRVLLRNGELVQWAQPQWIL